MDDKFRKQSNKQNKWNDENEEEINEEETVDEERPETADEQDLYEELDEEEIRAIIQEQKIQQATQPEKKSKPKRPFPKWVFWLIAVFMVINIGAALPRLFSLPAIEFLQTSVSLFMDEDMQEYKESIALVDTGNSKGTGFSVHPEGYIITNEHVIDDREQLWVYINEEGPYGAEVIHTYEEIDLAVLDLEGDGFPYLEVANDQSIDTNQPIYFIGNPLRFSGIANEGTIIGTTGESSLDSEVIMLDAPVYRGNSGSPVMTEDGTVIGVIYATREDADYGRIGLAVPIESLLERTGDSILPE